MPESATVVASSPEATESAAAGAGAARPIESIEPAGPEELLRLKREYLVPCTYHFYREPPQFISGHGCTLQDHRGRTYIDGFSGVTVMNAGHGRREIISAAARQAARLQHTTSILLTEPVLRLAERLAAIAPGDLRRSFFCASGTEAVEGAMMLASIHTGRSEIVAFTDSLHGRTRWALSATGLDMWRADPAPLDGVHRVPYGDADALEAVLSEHGDRIAAVIGETVQGNGGVVVPPADFWPRARAATRAAGAMLVLDEIQCGMNRTGRWWACDHVGVVPDILCTSKGLGNGYPIAAYIASDAVAGSWTRPSASTYGGNPVCSAAALATIGVHQSDDLGRTAAVRGEQLAAGLALLHATHPDRTGVPRGLGLMRGVPIRTADDVPDPAALDGMLEALLHRGILAGKSGAGRDILTFLPPLSISESEVDHVIDATLDAAAAVLRG